MTETTTNVPGQRLISADSGKPTGAGTPADALEDIQRMSESESDSNQSIDNRCPTCGEFFKSSRGVKIHHKQAHGESIAGVLVSCATCNEQWRIPKSKKERRDNLFCSRDCYSEWLSENYSGRNGPSWNGGPLTVGCEQCGSSFEKKPTEVKSSNHDFCSHGCYSDWLSDRPPEYHSRWEGGSVEYYGPNWPKQRNSVLERDEYECQKCGMESKEHQTKYGCELHVHHIKPRLNFVADGEYMYKNANRLTNLVTLCASCHAEIEGLPIDTRHLK